MKRGTFYAKRIKRLFSKLKQEHGTPEVPEPTDPLHQLLLAMLASETSNQRGARAMKALFDVMVDVNEIRVSTNAEIAKAISPHVPNPIEHADAIRRALDAVFRKEHAIQLDRLNKLGRREARQYLHDLSGVDAASAASVVLWSLGGHAIPVDERLYEALRKADMVDASASIDEVQAFLERNVNANDAKVFCLLMNKFIAAKGQRSSTSAVDDGSIKARPTVSTKKKSTRSADEKKSLANKSLKNTAKR